MKILLSAYGCSPVMGSEPGVGWRWAYELSKTHSVTILTHPYFRESIESELSANPNDKISVVYYEPKRLGIRRKPGSLNSRSYYMAWQLGLYFRARALCKNEKFDFAQHLTWGTFRLPTFLGLLNIPLVIGPVGGGEIAPLRLFSGLPLKVKLSEIARLLFIYSSRIDPVLRLSIARASLILCKTRETYNALPSSCQKHAVIASEIGSPDVGVSKNRNRSSNEPVHLLYAGRLIGLKGVSILIDAMLHVVNSGIPVTLTIIGDGDLRNFLEKKVSQLKLERNVIFAGQLSREDLLERYHDADIFVFPSLHDSSGNVILEAMSRGVPVVCLDLGGPKYFVDESCAIVIPTGAANVSTIALRLGNAIVRLASNPDQRARMSSAALNMAMKLTWRMQVDKASKLISVNLELT